MYSPKIREEYNPILYQIAKTKGVPMTQVVREAIDEYLNKSEMLVKTQKGGKKNNS